jgi:methylated-DNA-[protein]-cysteine S-methyltransferase
MAKGVKYTIFKTKWGYFGLAANGKGLFRTVLPCPTLKITKKYLVAGLDNPKFEKNLLKPLQNKIIAYFEGKPVNFNEPLDLANHPAFTKKVLAACKKIPSGKTITYSQLAAMIGKPNASRAVGNALAKNPIPLIVPCHRVIRRDGSIGRFSAPGGVPLKKRLIALESRCLSGNGLDLIHHTG